MAEIAQETAATILNVDGDDASRFAITQILQKAGFRVREAATAAEALASVAQGPDLVVLELRLPDAGGMEVCRRLKADAARASVPVLVLSADCHDSRCRVACFEAGADACLARPVVADELVAQVRTLLRLGRAERQLRERAEEVEKLLDVLPVAVWIAHDPACRSMTGNRASYELLGLPPRSNVSVTAPENERPALRQLRDGRELPPEQLPMQQAAAHGVEVRDAEFDFVLPGGATKHIYGSAAPLLDFSGEVRGCVGVFMDLTERRRVEQALRASERRFKTLAGSAPVGIFETDAEGNCLFVNDRWCQVAGMTAEAARGQGWVAALHPEDRDRIFHEWYTAAKEGREFAGEYRFRTPQGEVTWLSGRAVALRDESGEVTGYIGTITDISGLKRAEAELRKADRRKDEFLATLAHELRNPLAPIRNAAQILKARGPADPNLEWARTVIDRQVELMARLLDDLLDVSRISRGKLQLRRGRVELAAVVRSALETSRPHIAEMGHQLTITLPGQPVVLEADLSRLAQVFLNLLTNAAKYTDRGGRITLTADQQDRDVVVTVKDSGIGIPADQLPHIFEMFTQVNHSSERSRGGLGIGLSLVQRLVEMHGGRIEARSDGLGRGSEFMVRLPVVVETTGPAAGSAEERPATGASLRILVVDDSRDGADSLAMMLRIRGNDIRTAYDGEEAAAAAEAFRPDVILLDIGLPKLNGYEVCRRIREQPWGTSMVIIAQTGWGQEEDRQRSREAGFDHHMVKPVDPHELLRLLAGVKTT